MKYALFLSGPMILLAACGSPAPTETAEPSATGTAADTGAPVSTPTPVPEAPASDVATAIPAQIQGRWGLVAADCTSSRGDAKGLLEIDATTLKFYESLGTLTAVRESAATRLVGEFAFIGEGMEWQRVMTLDAQDSGQTLIRREAGEGAMPGALQYSRCA